jgi:hypothetical protein
MKRLALLPLAAVLVLLACTDSQLSPPDSKPQFEIYGRSVEDGFGGYNQEVFFDSPLGTSPSSQAGYDAGAFNAFLRPHVRVCELIGDPTMYPAVPNPADGPNPNLSCGTDVTPDPATYPYGLPMELNSGGEIYKVNFKTDNLTDGTFYRVEVFAVPAAAPVDDDFRAAFLLGHRDIAALDGPSVASCGLDAVCNVNIPSNIPIKVRVESFALCPPDVEQCVTKFVDFSAGEELALQGGTRIDIPAQNSDDQALLTFRSCTPAELQDVMDRTDLPTFGTCLATDTDFSGVLTPEAVISICDANDFPIDEDRVWDDPQEHTITLFHFSDQVGQPVYSLPHAATNCGTFGSEPSNPLIRLAMAVKDGLLSVVTPEPLEATMVLLHRGGGYGTSGLASKFMMVLPGKFEYVDPNDAERVALVGSTVPAAVKVTDLYGNPIKGARVRFDSPTPDGFVTASEIITDFDKDNPDPSSDGVASVDWTIASTPKVNELFVWGRTIADNSSETNNGPRTAPPYGPYDPFLALNTTFDGPSAVEAEVTIPVYPNRTGLTFTVIGCAPGFGTPDLPLNGQLGQDEWQCAQHEQFPVNLSKGSTVMADLYWMNDGSNFYAAVVVPGSDRVNSLRFDWDSDGDAPVGIEGPAEEGDDVWEFDPSSGGLDRYLTAKCTNSSQASCGADDAGNDVTGAFRNDLGGVTVYEISHPLSTGEALNGLSIDLDAVAGDMAGFFVTLRLGSGAQGNTQWPGFRVYKKTQIQ